MQLISTFSQLYSFIPCCQYTHSLRKCLQSLWNRIIIWAFQTILRDIKIKRGTYPMRLHFIYFSCSLCLHKISLKTSSFMSILLCTRGEQTIPNDFSSNIISLYVWLHDDWCELLFRNSSMKRQGNACFLIWKVKQRIAIQEWSKKFLYSTFLRVQLKFLLKSSDLL